MQQPAHGRRALPIRVIALAPTAPEPSQGRGLERCPPPRARRQSLTEAHAGRAQEPHERSHRENQYKRAEDKGRDQHRVLADNAIKRARAVGPAPQAGMAERQVQRHQDDEGGERKSDHRDRRVPEQRPQHARSRELLVGHLASFSEQRRYVDRPLVWLGVHARLPAGAAVVTQAGDIAEVALGEEPLSLQRWKHRAVALAIPTCVADRELPLPLAHELCTARTKFSHSLIRARQGAPKRSRSSFRSRPDIPVATRSRPPARRPQTGSRTCARRCTRRASHG